MSEASALPDDGCRMIEKSLTSGVAESQALAAALARQCQAGDCLLLHGDLGAGKTTFARGFIQALQSTPEEVVSPTFTLVQNYPARNGTMVWHFDLYRIKEAGELAEIDLDEALNNGITLIEWPGIAQSRLPEAALNVTIEMAEHPEQRQFTFSGPKDPWQARLALMKDNV